MAKKVACKSLGHQECPFEARAESEQEALTQLEEHARSAHNLQEEQRQEFEAKARAAIQEA